MLLSDSMFNFANFQIMSIQQYQLGDCISTNPGAFTLVHLSQRIGDSRKFAVRLFNNELHQQEELLATFIADCERLLNPKLSHANIIQHEGIYSDILNNRHGLIMEMMETSLTLYLHNSENIHQPVPFPIQIGLSHDIAHALAYLHQNGIIHQNLTAKSVFLMQDSHTNLPLAKIGDFGMVNFLQRAGLCTDVPSMKSNILSFGALVTEIMSKQYVHPSDTPKIDSIISLLDNPLVSIVKYCFEEDCLTADILTMRIAKQSITYTCRQVEQEEIVQVQMLQSADAQLQRSCDAVMDHTRKIVYLRQGKYKKVFALNLNHNAWEDRPDCKLLQCALVLFDGDLLAIGGTETDESQRSDAVYKLVEDVQNPEWKLHAIGLFTARSRATALVCKFNNKDVLIIAGGERRAFNVDPKSKFESLRTVEVGTQQSWNLACALPGTLCCASATVFKGNICLLGGWSERGVVQQAVYTCHLSKLMGTLNSPTAQVWSEVGISPCPVGSTTCLTLGDKLLIVGGNQPKGDTAIRVYNECTKNWDIVGHLPEARYLCYAHALCKCRFVVIGGCKSSSVPNGDTYIFELK